jgi:hypothetical protein
MVPLQNPRREIGGTTYEVQLWPTSVALEWQERLAFLGLEPLAMLLAERQIPWTNVENDDMVVIARTLLQRLRDEGLQLAPLLKKVIEGAAFEVKNSPEGPVLLELKAYETRFRGRTKDVYRLALFVLEANLADFIDAVRSSAVVRRLSLLLASSDASAGGETATDPSSTPPSPSTSTAAESAG